MPTRSSHDERSGTGDRGWPRRVAGVGSVHALCPTIVGGEER